MPAFIENLSNIKFFRPYVTIKRSGDTDYSTGGGAVQSINLNHEWGTTELRGPEALPPLGVGITEENLSFSGEQAVFNAELLEVLLGASSTYSAGTNKTTTTKTVNTEPARFDLKIQTPDDGADLEVILYGCLMSTYDLIRADNRTFGLQSFAGRVFGEGTAASSKLMDWISPGNLTNAS